VSLSTSRDLLNAIQALSQLSYTPKYFYGLFFLTARIIIADISALVNTYFTEILLGKIR